MQKSRVVIIAIILLLPIISLSNIIATQDVIPAKTETLGETKAVKKVAVVFATGGLGDKSFNDAGIRGLIRAEAEFGTDLIISYVEPKNVAEFKDYQRDYAELETYDLIICIGFLQKDALNETSVTYPDQKWVLIDEKITRSNVKSYLYKEHEGSFLVGAMAGMTTQTGKIGFVGGMDIYVVNKFLAGYVQGAHHINSSIEITAVYRPLPPPDCWNNIPSGKNMGKTLIGKGNDTIFAAAGLTGIGVFQAADEADDTYAIGVDSNQDGEMPGVVLCSVLKLVETATYNSIRDIMQDTWTSGVETLGLKENGMGISPMKYTTTEANTSFILNCINKTRWEHIKDIIDQIKSGELVVSDTSTEYEKLATSATTTTISMITSGFEIYWVISLVIFNLMFGICKRKK
ncbi:MAG: BMP family protein [Candidatus Hodarchaeota archaeon]